MGTIRVETMAFQTNDTPVYPKVLQYELLRKKPSLARVTTLSGALIRERTDFTLHLIRLGEIPAPERKVGELMKVSFGTSSVFVPPNLIPLVIFALLSEQNPLKDLDEPLVICSVPVSGIFLGLSDSLGFVTLNRDCNISIRRLGFLKTSTRRLHRNGLGGDLITTSAPCSQLQFLPEDTRLVFLAPWAATMKTHRPTLCFSESKVWGFSMLHNIFPSLL